MRASLRRDLLTKKVLDQEVGAKVTISDQEVSDFFNANRAQFNLPEDSYHLAQIVVERGCQMGVAFDGDGDRAIFADHRGGIVDGDAVLLMCARQLRREI